MTHEREYPDLDFWLDQPDPHEDADGWLHGWTGRSPDAATWTQEEQ